MKAIKAFFVDLFHNPHYPKTGETPEETAKLAEAHSRSDYKNQW